MKPFYIFDLDGTCIDSRHRYRETPEGSIDLQYWLDNCTPEKIAQDSLLPTAQKLIRYKMEGRNVVICTARVMQDADYSFLERHGLYVEACLSREPGDSQSDADLKEGLIEGYLNVFHNTSLDEARVVMFEDNLTVIERLRKRMVTCLYVGSN